MIPLQLEQPIFYKDHQFSIEAMGYQQDIAGKSREKGGDYLLMLKGNQPSTSLQSAVETAVIDAGDAL